MGVGFVLTLLGLLLTCVCSDLCVAVVFILFVWRLSCWWLLLGLKVLLFCCGFVLLVLIGFALTVTCVGVLLLSHFLACWVLVVRGWWFRCLFALLGLRVVLWWILRCVICKCLLLLGVSFLMVGVGVIRVFTLTNSCCCAMHWFSSGFGFLALALEICGCEWVWWAGIGFLSGFAWVVCWWVVVLAGLWDLWCLGDCLVCFGMEPLDSNCF